MTLREFTERGLHYPLSITVGLSVMVLWNLFFISQALRTAPEVDLEYVNATHR